LADGAVGDDATNSEKDWGMSCYEGGKEDMHDPIIFRMLAYKCDASPATGGRVLQGTGFGGGY
jgi:hypothetical protein